MLSQFLCDDILPYFLLNDLIGILVNLNNAIDLTVDVIMEHILYSHGWPPKFR